MQTQICVVFIILTGTAIVAQDISSFKLLPDDCSTQCKCIFSYEVSLTESLPDTSSLIFELKESSSKSFKKLYTLNLNSDCTGFVALEEVYCTEIDRNVFIISFNPKQISRLRQAKCRAYLNHVNRVTNYTNSLNFPKFVDPLEAIGSLHINGLNMSSDHCNTSIDSKDLTLEFDCDSAAKPCVIDMEVNGDTVVKQSENYGTFKGSYNQGDDLIVKVKYSACRLHEHFNTITCKVATEFIPSEEKNKFIFFLALGIGLSILVIAVIIMICFVCKRRRRHFATENRKSSSRPLIELEQKEECVINLDQTIRSTPGKASIKRKAVVDQEDTDVWTPLMLAANKGHTSTVSKLITNGAEVNARGPEDLTALMLASENGYLAIVKRLLKKGANVNDKDCEGWTALMFASQNGHVDIVKYLIKNKANIDDRNNDDLTAMIIASQNEQTHIAELLDKIGGNHEKKKYKKSVTRKSTIYQSRSSCVMDNTINKNKENILDKDAFLKELCKSLKNRDEDKDDITNNENVTSNVYETIYKPDVLESASEVHDTGKKNSTTKDIINAIEIGSTDTVERILKEGFDVNTVKGSNALIFASIKGRTEIVDLLIKNKAGVNDMDKNGLTALLHASEHGQTDVVKLLLEKGANVDKKENKRWTALMFACQNGHTDTARLLIENGANVNDKERQGWTALMLACLHGHIETIQLLVVNGADLEQKEADGWTALMLSSLNGHAETVSLLLEHGANITKNEINEFTPLMLASQNGHAKVVQLLLDNGVDVNETECSGFTALMLASQNGHLETAKLLIDKGANIHIKNKDDWTALMCAADNGYEAVVDLLSHLIHV